MTISFKNIGKIVTVALIPLFFAACNDGEAEQAGEKIDKTLKDAGNAIEDKCEDIKEGVGAEDKDC